MERNGTEWNEMERNGTKWNGMEQIGTKWNGTKWNEMAKQKQERKQRSR